VAPYIEKLVLVTAHSNTQTVVTHTHHFLSFEKKKFEILCFFEKCQMYGNIPRWVAQSISRMYSRERF
jgi:hypothetical protein